MNLLYKKEEPRKVNINLIEKYKSSNPLLLLSKTFINDIDYINNLLPFSIGIEIECNQLKSFNIDNFKRIPFLIEVNCDSLEQRFRIPNGLEGLICLYLVCEQLKLNSSLNLDSGSHFHCDCTNYQQLLSVDLLKKHQDFIFRELDLWDYKGTYNKKAIAYSKGCWLNVRDSFKTLEFRIGEMTFDYSVLSKRIFSVVHIVETIINIEQINKNHIYQPVNNTILNTYLKTTKFNNQKIDTYKNLLTNYVDIETKVVIEEPIISKLKKIII